jgi:dTDP-4-dehydrorhamnose 3,5-epimerase-like enzyme
MNIIKTDIPEVLIFEPRVFGDARGFFFESFSSKVFDEAVGGKWSLCRITTPSRRRRAARAALSA